MALTYLISIFHQHSSIPPHLRLRHLHAPPPPPFLPTPQPTRHLTRPRNSSHDADRTPARALRLDGNRASARAGVANFSPPRLVSVYGYGKVHICYFFGYDELRNEHKVLNIRMFYGMGRPSSVEIFLFELSSFAWRKIDAEIPVDISGETWDESAKRSVCVNSVIHLMLVFETNEMDLWMLKDYEERVWVKETIVFGQWWTDLDAPFPLECFNVNEIAFVPKRVSKNMIRVPVYDMKTRRFKSVKYYLGGHFLRSRTVVFHQVRSYVQSILPLERNEATSVAVDTLTKGVQSNFGGVRMTFHFGAK
ncbi:F-box domain-containing protein [Artemisia annua]|uniref:F-box domain-containing protein n=1 Tax=Artemisia annua TaxID=35608 RepID=A0A2U1NWQ0_ARTAN|nr:F-box domain-containing protein [Artemisia annua]